MPKRFYITTTLPYVNSDPHIGFALEIVQADVLARYRRALGDKVVFNTGTDEHGLKIYRKAVEEGKDPQKYTDEYAARFDNLKKALNLSYTNFIRTTDPHHKAAAQEFWKRCDANGFIYKKNYQIKYCVGCELEKTDSELIDGKCPIHSNLEVELINEENYFFKFSAFQEKLLDFYKANPDFVVPDFRFNEIKKFVEGGLQDFSVSRLKSKMPWGVPVPGDNEQVMYVWFDALVNYISTLGWPLLRSDGASKGKPSLYEDFWPGMQVAGKDNLRQQSAMWQAMLMAADLPNSRQILIHGFITSNGQKMSKSLGNVVDPFDLVKRYGIDAVRYWLLRELNPFEDGDFTEASMLARYNGDLANNIGNLVSRVRKLFESLRGETSKLEVSPLVLEQITKTKTVYHEAVREFKFHEALAHLWELYTFANVYINEKEPWKTGDTAAVFSISHLLQESSALLEPFLPETAQKIRSGVSGPLFPKLP